MPRLLPAILTVLGWLWIEWAMLWLLIAATPTGENLSFSAKQVLIGGVHAAAICLVVFAVFAVDQPRGRRTWLLLLSLLPCSLLLVYFTWHQQLAIFFLPLFSMVIALYATSSRLMRHLDKAKRHHRSIASIMFLTLWIAILLTVTRVLLRSAQYELHFCLAVSTMSLIAVSSLLLSFGRHAFLSVAAMLFLLTLAGVVLAVASADWIDLDRVGGSIILLISHCLHLQLFLFLLRSVGYRLG